MAGTRPTEALRVVGRQEWSCAQCGAQTVETVEQRHTFRYGSGESAADLTVELPVRRCTACGFEFLDQQSEEIKLEAICEHLRVLSPAGIRRIRTRHGMTQAEFAEVTGLGTASLVRWENGSMNHTRAYDRYIRLLDSPNVMRRLKRLAGLAGTPIEQAHPGDERWRVRKVTEDVRRHQRAFVLRPAA